MVDDISHFFRLSLLSLSTDLFFFLSLLSEAFISPRDSSRELPIPKIYYVIYMLSPVWLILLGKRLTLFPPFALISRVKASSTLDLLYSTCRSIFDASAIDPIGVWYVLDSNMMCAICLCELRGLFNVIACSNTAGGKKVIFEGFLFYFSAKVILIWVLFSMTLLRQMICDFGFYLFFPFSISSFLSR